MFLSTFLPQISPKVCSRLKDIVKIVRLLLAAASINWLMHGHAVF